MNEAAAIGHNNPPDEIQIIVQGLQEKYSKAEARYNELVASAGRAPTMCKDDETAAKISDLIKLMNSHRKFLDTARSSEKEPFRKKADAVHGYFVRMVESIDGNVLTLKKPLASFLQAKADEERRRAREEQERAEAESRRLAEEARKLEQSNATAANAALDQAIAAEEAANKAAQTVAARPAELASTRGSYGSRGGLSTRWVGVITNREQLDLNALRPYFSNDDLQKAVNGYVKANCKGSTGASLTGAEIKEQTSAVVR